MAYTLRPLSLAELLDRTFFLYRRHFLLFVGIAAIPNLFGLAFGIARLLITPNLIGILVTLFGALASMFVILVTTALAQGATVIAVSQVLTSRTRWGAALAAELARALGPLTLFECAALAALSGFGEEVFFRGALQPRLGWLGASVLFGLAHVAPRRALWPWTGFAFAAGLLLGALFAATGNLVAPIAAHAAINAVNLRLLTRDQ